jgi:hypothetical protein
MALPAIPQELVDYIIDHLHNDKPSLAACSLVCRDWIPPSRYHFLPKLSLNFVDIHHCLYILESPLCTIVPRIRHLSLHGFHGARFRVALSRLASRLLHVRRLSLVSVQWCSPCQGEFTCAFPELSELILVDCHFKTMKNFVDCIGTWHEVESVTVSNTLWLFETTVLPFRPSRLPCAPVALRTLHLKTNPKSPILQWLLHHPRSYRDLSSFSAEDVSDGEILPLTSFIQSVGPTLQSLRISSHEEGL